MRRCGVKPAAEVRAAQIGGSILGCAREHKRRADRQRCDVERLMHRVAGSGVCELEREQFPGRQAVPAAA